MWHRGFPVNFAKFLRATFLQNTSGRLLLCISNSKHHSHYLYMKRPISSNILSNNNNKYLIYKKGFISEILTRTLKIKELGLFEFIRKNAIEYQQENCRVELLIKKLKQRFLLAIIHKHAWKEMIKYTGLNPAG